MTTKTATKQEIVKKFQMHEKDTGSTEVQVALLTDRILYLTEHFKEHKKDYHSKRGLLMLVARRKKLLNYLKNKDSKKYMEVLKELNLKKDK